MRRILALDPSSTAVGWAIFDVQDLSRRVSWYGCLRAPRKLKGPERTDWFCDELDECVGAIYDPTEVVIEIPSGKVNPARHGGGGSGLAVYGYAVGRIEERIRGWSDRFQPAGVVRLNEIESTGGHSKEKRRKVALKECPGLAEMKDPGNDISDAIALGVWYLDVFPKLQAKKRVKERKKKCRKSGTGGSRRKSSRAAT